MPKKKQLAEGEAMIAQLNVRVTATMLERLEATAAGYGLDVSNLARMLISESLPFHEERAQKLGKRQAPR